VTSKGFGSPAGGKRGTSFCPCKATSRGPVPTEEKKVSYPRGRKSLNRVATRGTENGGRLGKKRKPALGREGVSEKGVHGVPWQGFCECWDRAFFEKVEARGGRTTFGQRKFLKKTKKKTAPEGRDPLIKGSKTSFP